MSDKAEKMAQELRNRFQYFYMKTDGSYEFPNSAEGDLLRMTSKLLKELQEEYKNA
ncbi:hypothetical protein [Carnobacterium maltaromaticum]|uniref:hypothetical protein n=1 Tax=Carnobacterium maltaromaticum TaxID=2751 RepID=UPI00165B88E5|nr:hypothetical protein [Carnobacterium maltaromaticum]MBC9788601.1 hypothetical protein [Carnobacterium maltaromaticum]